MIIKLAILTGLRPRADKSASMTFTTAMECPPEEFKILHAMFQDHCMIAIKPEDSPFLDAELNDLDHVDLDLEDTTKTPSKRLRNVLFRLWEKTSKDPAYNVEFKQFYKVRMEQLIEQIKNKLD